MTIRIDLGTINSLAVCCRDGETVIIPNRLNENLMPSVVAMDERAQILVRKTARKYSYLHPEQSAKVFKRFIGSDRQYKLGGYKFRPENLSAMVIRTLREDAEKFLGETVTEAVISVPAYFDDKRREATELAGKLAGLKVERIISEPAAAATTYGLYDRTENIRFLMFDLGGGTFSASILEPYGSTLKARAMAEDGYLGGENFTRALEKEFLKRNEIDEEKLSKKTATAVHEAVKNYRKLFSRGDKAVMECKIDGEKKTLTIDLKEYGRLCEPFLERVRKPFQRSIPDTHAKLSGIDEVVLVSGTTGLPVIREFIVKLFHKFLNTSVHPDEAVALGAIVQGAMKAKDREAGEIILTDVCAFTLGTEVSMEGREDVYGSGHFCPIIERDTMAPTNQTERLYTVHDRWEKVRTNVHQGESRLTVNNLLLGSLEIPVPKSKAGEEAVDVTYIYDINSILEAGVKVVSTGRVKRQIIRGKYNTMTGEEVQVRMEELFYLETASRDQEEGRLLLSKGEQCYKENIGDRRLAIKNCMRELELILDSRDRKRIVNAERKLWEEINKGEEREEKAQRTRQEAARMLSGCG